MDIKHFFIGRGEGEPLVLLHGNGENGGYFENQLTFFAEQGYRCIAPDTRGHGNTPRGDAPFTIDQFARDLDGFFDGIGLTRAHVLGFSDGANIALTFALAFPARVDKLILNGANLNPDGVKRTFQRQIEREYERLGEAVAAGDEGARRQYEYYGLMVNDPHIPPDRLAGVRAPTLVIAGTDDMIISAHTRLIAARIPGSELAFVEGDHFVAKENPDAFNRRVLAFLKK